MDIAVAPFKFKVAHTRGTEKVVADALSRMFEGQIHDDPEVICGTMMKSLPLVYSSLKEHQENEGFCVKLREQVEKRIEPTLNFKFITGCCAIFPEGRGNVGGWSLFR